MQQSDSSEKPYEYPVELLKALKEAGALTAEQMKQQGRQ